MFEPDEAVLDGDGHPTMRGAWIDTRHDDMLLVWREYGEQFDGGMRTHVVSAGAFEHITHAQIVSLLAHLRDDADPHEEVA